MELITAQITPITPEMVQWAINGDRNAFDPTILTYPSLGVLKLGTRTGKTVMYLPAQTVIMLESLAINPEATDREIAVGLLTAFNALLVQAQGKGIGEVYFLGSNELTNKFAERHGMEKLDFPIFRMKTQFQEPTANEILQQINPQR